MAVVLDKEQIKEIIPHRDPFLLIDEVNELEVGKKVKATKYIKDFVKRGFINDTIFEESSFSLLTDILKQAGELDENVPYNKLVTTDFSKKAVK